MPYMAKRFDAFVPPEEILPMTQAIARVFGRLDERKIAIARASSSGAGSEPKFKEVVLEERRDAPYDLRAGLNTLRTPNNSRKRHSVPAASGHGSRLRRVQALGQHQHAPTKAGRLRCRYCRASAWRHHRQSASFSCGHCPALKGNRPHHSRTNFVILAGSARAICPKFTRPWKPSALAIPAQVPSVDIVTCPGTDTCKLGISSSRGLAGELHKALAEKSFQLDESVQRLHIKISGCFNSCGQHHVSDLGFYGVGHKIGGFAVHALSCARWRVGTLTAVLTACPS